MLLLLRPARRTSPAFITNAVSLLSQYSTLSGTTEAPRLAPEHSTSRPLQHLNFADHTAVFAGQPTAHLLRAWLVFRLCNINLFVRHADKLLAASKQLLGPAATTFLVRHTFFAHFCAGEDGPEVWRTMRRLEQQGIGAILDFAAEDDVQQQQAQPLQGGRHPPELAPGSRPQHPQAATPNAAAQHLQAQAQAQAQQGAGNRGNAPKGGLAVPLAGPASDIGASADSPHPAPSGVLGDAALPLPGPGMRHATGPAALDGPLQARAVARQYDYCSEQQCDAHVQIFLQSIEAAAGLGRQGFAAVKLTGLGNPRLLERVSSAILVVRGLFQQFDRDGSGSIDRSEFDRVYRAALPAADDAELQRAFQWLDSQGTGSVDYVAWCQRLSLTNMPRYASRLTATQQGGWVQPFREAALTEEEVQLVQAMRRRLHTLAEAALAKGVKLMVDAEHSYFQPAIDHLTLELMRTYNRGRRAVIFNTYQAYLVDAQSRLGDDLERSRREGYVLGAKLVRGAYLDLERRHAAQLGKPSPVWPTLQATHNSYDACMDVLLAAVQGGRAEVLLGSHNQASMERAVAQMAARGLHPATSHVYFGQLLGMSDHLTQTLGRAGYQSYKYVPYGRVDQVLPYLLRRAAENASILKSAKKDVQLLEAELKARFLPRFLLPQTTRQTA